MNNDWQTWTAAGIVALTAGIFAIRFFTRKKTGCGSGCGCGAARKVQK